MLKSSECIMILAEQLRAGSASPHQVESSLLEMPVSLVEDLGRTLLSENKERLHLVQNGVLLEILLRVRLSYQHVGSPTLDIATFERVVAELSLESLGMLLHLYDFKGKIGPSSLVREPFSLISDPRLQELLCVLVSHTEFTDRGRSQRSVLAGLTCLLERGQQSYRSCLRALYDRHPVVLMQMLLQEGSPSDCTTHLEEFLIVVLDFPKTAADLLVTLFGIIDEAAYHALANAMICILQTRMNSDELTAAIVALLSSRQSLSLPAKRLVELLGQLSPAEPTDLYEWERLVSLPSDLEGSVVHQSVVARLEGFAVEALKSSGGFGLQDDVYVRVRFSSSMRRLMNWPLISSF